MNKLLVLLVPLATLPAVARAQCTSTGAVPVLDAWTSEPIGWVPLEAGVSVPEGGTVVVKATSNAGARRLSLQYRCRKGRLEYVQRLMLAPGPGERTIDGGAFHEGPLPAEGGEAAFLLPCPRAARPVPFELRLEKGRFELRLTEKDERVVIPYAHVVETSPPSANAGKSRRRPLMQHLARHVCGIDEAPEASVVERLAGRLRDLVAEAQRTQCEADPGHPSCRPESREGGIGVRD